MAGHYFGYDGPFPPFNDSLVHHYVFTLYALSVERAAGRGRVHRRRRCARRWPATCSARPRTRAPTRSTAGCCALKRRRQRSHPHRRDPPRRDGLERRHAHAGPARHRARTTPAAGRRSGWRRRWPTRPSTPIYASDLSRALRHRAGAGRRGGPARARPTPACASAASASSRAAPTPRSTRRWPDETRALARARPRRSRPSGGESAARLLRPLRRRGRSGSPRGTRGQRDRARHARRRARLPVPRRHPRGARRAAHLAARQRAHQPPAAHDAGLHAGRLERHPPPRQAEPRRPRSVNS